MAVVAAKSDFNMSPLQMLGGLRGINGLTGTLGLGLPIYALSGLDMAGGRIADEDHTELMAIISGADFDDATLNYLTRTRDFLLKSKENKGKMSHIQNPDQFISMIDQAIKFWNTPQRDQVLDKLATIEDKLAKSGFIKYDSEAMQGLAELDDLDEELDGLNGQRSLGGFFKSLKRIGKKVGKGIKKGAKAVAKVGKKVVKAIVRFNPLSIAIRNGLLAAMRLNMFGIAKKLQYAFLPDNLAAKHNIDPQKLADLKKRYAKVRKLFDGLQGKEKNLRSAILKGAKQKSPDFSVKGVQGIVAGLQGLEAIGQLAELGSLGVAATAASVGAATGVLAKITSWLQPVTNIFKKAKEKIVARKQARQQATQVQAQPQPQTLPHPQNIIDTREVFTENLTPIMPIAPVAPTASYTIPNLSPANANTPYLPSPTPTNMARTPTAVSPTKGISKGAKVGIGLGLAALIGTGAYFMFRDKGNKPKTTTPAKVCRPTKKQPSEKPKPSEELIPNPPQSGVISSSPNNPAPGAKPLARPHQAPSNLPT